MEQQFPPQLPNWTQVWSPRGAQMKAYFQLSTVLYRGNPGSESTCLNALAHSGAKERLRHLHSWFWVQFTHDVQTGYKYNNKIKKKKEHKQTTLRIKKLPTPICYPPPFRFKVIRTNQAIIQDYFFPTLKFNFLFTFHEKNTIIVQKLRFNLSTKTEAFALIVTE